MKTFPLHILAGGCKLGKGVFLSSNWIIAFLLSYLRYYYDNQDVKNDKEFGNYLNELSSDGKLLSLHSRIGRVSLQSVIIIDVA